MAIDAHFFTPAWPVFYEDNHLLALYKPAGLLIQGDRSGDISLLELAKSWLKQRHAKPGRVFLGLVHRLDRPVAGVVLFARTSKSAGRLSAQFRSGGIKKQYVAVVEGGLKEKSGRLVHQMERDSVSGRIVENPTDQSREARLFYRVLDTHGARSLVEVDLETGRHHQIRLQLAHMGCPIVGDLRYGASSPLPDKQIALLASRITLTHPTLHTQTCFTCPYPQGWPWPGLGDTKDATPWNWKSFREIFSERMPTDEP